MCRLDQQKPGEKFAFINVAMFLLQDFECVRQRLIFLMCMLTEQVCKLCSEIKILFQCSSYATFPAKNRCSTGEFQRCSKESNSPKHSQFPNQICFRILRRRKKVLIIFRLCTRFGEFPTNKIVNSLVK